MDTWIRILIPVAIVAVAVGVGLIANRVRRPIHPEIVVGDIGDRPGVVLFTSTDCSNCKRTITRLKDMAIPFREVTHELEPQRFEEWQVVAVPLTVVLDADSAPVALLTGTPTRRELSGAITTAGLAPSP